MRAYIYSSGAGDGHLFLPMTSNRVASQHMIPSRETWLVQPRSMPKAGWYRAKATWNRHGFTWEIEIGQKIDPTTESARLARAADALLHRHARTRTPGIVGCIEAEQRSQGAIDTHRAIHEYFATLLRNVAEAQKA